MATGTHFTPMTSRFDRVLSGHLANHIACGFNCDGSVVRECYAQTLKDLQLGIRTFDEPCILEVESFVLDNIVSLMQTHQRFLATMPIPVAARFIAELLNEKPW